VDVLIGISVTAVFVALFVLADFAPSMFRCRVESTGVRVRLFGLSVAHVPFDQITGVERESWRNLLLDGSLTHAQRIGVRVFRKPVVIWRGDRPPVLIAPHDPDKFVADVRMRLAGRLTSA